MTNTDLTRTNDDGFADAYGDGYGGRSLVALFADRDGAREAAHRLHDENFHDTWIGVTHAATDTYDGGEPMSPVGRVGVAPTSGITDSGDVVVESDSDSLGDKIGRFFTGETATRSLYDELVRHGVDRSEARRIEDQIPPESAVLTVDAANHPEAAAAIIEQCGGHLIAGESFASDSTATSATAATATAASTTAATSDSGTSPRGSQVLGYGDPQRYARGTEIDDERRLQLRAERLSVDKRQEIAGEATVGKDVVETRQEIDVPVMREELFVERRPASDSTASADVSPIGSDDTIHIPLLRERVVVTKRPVVTEEYVVGKRAVSETQHVSETTREERLRVDDGLTSTGTTASTGSATADDLADGARI